MGSASGPRMTLPTQLVLRVMIDDPSREVYGLELARLAELGTGTVPPILARLERCGWVSSRWEEEDPRHLGRPPRRYYRLTPDGAVFAFQALEKVKTPAAVLARLHPRPATGGTP